MLSLNELHNIACAIECLHGEVSNDADPYTHLVDLHSRIADWGKHSHSCLECQLKSSECMLTCTALGLRVKSKILFLMGLNGDRIEDILFIKHTTPNPISHNHVLDSIYRGTFVVLSPYGVMANDGVLRRQSNDRLTLLLLLHEIAKAINDSLADNRSPYNSVYLCELWLTACLLAGKNVLNPWEGWSFIIRDLFQKDLPEFVTYMNSSKKFRNELFKVRPARMPFCLESETIEEFDSVCVSNPVSRRII